MNDYYQLRLDINPCCEDATDYMAALLGDLGYESFVPDAEGLTAYIKAECFDPQPVEDVISDFPFACKISTKSEFVPGQDWNSEWEKNYFKPIVVGGECVIHGSFHTDIPKAKYDIVIDPKMAFGTGHHSTTALIISQLLKLDLKQKAVIDMGTGTGILAILAALRGASPVYGIEIDGFAYENALDNVKINHHPEINLINGDASSLQGLPMADCFIANINRNVITADIQSYACALKPGGVMLLSGFYEQDVPIVLQAAEPYGLTEVEHNVGEGGWTCLRLTKA